MTALLVLALLAAPADTVVVGTLGDPLSLEPHRATDLLSAAIVANVCETLVRYRADGTRPDLVFAEAGVCAVYAGTTPARADGSGSSQYATRRNSKEATCRGPGIIC